MSFAGSDSWKAWSIRQTPALFATVTLQQIAYRATWSDESSVFRRNVAIVSLLAAVYLSYIIFWRLYLSPISKFPGPKLAAATWLYEMYYDIYKDGQYHFKLQDLHKKYGPIIRVNPRELHVSDPSYWDSLYSHKGRWDKSPLFCAQFGSTEAEVLTVSHDKHRARRAVLAPFFSKQKVLAMESVIQDQIEIFCNRIEKERKENEKEEDHQLPIRLAINCLTLAIVCEFCFGGAYRTLDFDDWGHQWAKANAAGFKSTHWARLLPFLAHLENMAPTSLLLWLLKDESMLGFRELLLDVENARKSGLSDIAERQTVFSVLNSSDLPESEKSSVRFRNVMGQLINAGSDTSTNTLHMIVWYVLSDKQVLDRLRAEIVTVQPNPRVPAPLRQLEQLPYLTACIMEGLRLGNGVVQASPRAAPDRNIWYQEWEIPAGTPVGMSSPDLHYDEEIFPEPERFNPERWMDREKRNTLERYLVPFSKGTRMCLGLNLAWAELYMITAAIFTRFDLELAEGVNYEDHVKMAHANFFPQPRRDFDEFKVVVK